MLPSDARKNLAYLRLGLGAMWLTPAVGARLFGVDPEEQASVKLMGRLFAARGVAMAFALLKAEGAEADRQIDLNIAVDSADLAAVLMAASRREIGIRTLLLGGGAAAAALYLGLVGRGAGG
ncbi:MAG TPA: hypothetical protein VMM13_02325 [Euzebya sp.]|nr:hypothetical protein [Euzebya sp.]